MYKDAGTACMAVCKLLQVEKEGETHAQPWFGVDLEIVTFQMVYLYHAVQ